MAINILVVLIVMTLPCLTACEQSHSICDERNSDDGGATPLVGNFPKHEFGEPWGTWVVDYGASHRASYANGFSKGWRGFSLCRGNVGETLGFIGLPTRLLNQRNDGGTISYAVRDRSDINDYDPYKRAWQYTHVVSEILGADIQMILEYGLILNANSEMVESMKVTFVTVDENGNEQLLGPTNHAERWQGVPENFPTCPQH